MKWWKIPLWLFGILVAWTAYIFLRHTLIPQYTGPEGDWFLLGVALIWIIAVPSILVIALGTYLFSRKFNEEDD
jgi:hypothetical protein